MFAPLRAETTDDFRRGAKTKVCASGSGVPTRHVWRRCHIFVTSLSNRWVRLVETTGDEQLVANDARPLPCGDAASGKLSTTLSLRESVEKSLWPPCRPLRAADIEAPVPSINANVDSGAGLRRVPIA